MTVKIVGAEYLMEPKLLEKKRLMVHNIEDTGKGGKIVTTPIEFVMEKIYQFNNKICSIK